LSRSGVVVAGTNGDMERDHRYSAGREPADLEAPDRIGSTAARRTVERLGARKIKTTEAPVVFAPEVARGFIGHAIGAISGGAEYRRSSFLLDAAGNQIFPDIFRIDERPPSTQALACAACDAVVDPSTHRDIG